MVHSKNLYKYKKNLHTEIENNILQGVVENHEISMWEVEKNTA